MLKQITQVRILPNGDILALDENLNSFPGVRANIFSAVAEAAADAGYSANGAIVDAVNLPSLRIVPNASGDGWQTENA